jgi:hypothetical protein
MRYPSFAEYSDALLLNLGLVLSDPMLARGSLRTHGHGVPVAHGGTFALTFEVMAGDRHFAVRCFHKELEAVDLRYAAICDHLGRIDSPYFTDLEFQPSGIRTESGTYPIVRMDWVEGPTLASVVASQLHNPTVLQGLRDEMRRLARHLQGLGIAHGDIHPSNIIVQGAADLRLIDYDGMFVPELAALYAAELGHRNFQHPGRRARHFNAELDNFSFAVIDLALDALSHRPELWEATGSGPEAFLFRAADFLDPARSRAFHLLSAVPGFGARTQHLAAVCSSPFGAIPILEDFVAGRSIPAVHVVFSGDPGAGERAPYVSPYEIVDATDFARCCAHVGDRVELVGRIERVAAVRGTRTEPSHLRIEFGEPSHDMVCLKIWPDGLAGFGEAPDKAWNGQWLSAIGLIEPVSSGTVGGLRQKDVSMAVVEASQLQRINEAEGHRRLRGLSGRRDVAADDAGGIHTDPVSSSTEPPAASAQPQHRHQEPQPISAAVRRRPATRAWRRGILPIGAVAALVAFAIVLTRSPRDMPPTVEPAVNTPVATAPALSSTPGAAGALLTAESVSGTTEPLSTVAGLLTIVPAGDGTAAREVVLDGAPVAGLREETIELVHRAVFSDREVVVGFSGCAADGPTCKPRSPFWLELRPDRPPAVRLATDLPVGAGGGAVSTTEDGVAVDLGLWDGQSRRAVLTPAGNLLVDRSGQAARPLARDQCATVIRALEACARSRDCSSFQGSAQTIPRPTWNRLLVLYHETTGLDGPAFRTLCTRSCELGLTPSTAFVRANACNGAQPGQWLRADSGLGVAR